jgi:hypothetical protein
LEAICPRQSPILETIHRLLRKKLLWNISISIIKGSIEVYISFLDIVLGAPLFSNIIMEQGNSRFVNIIVLLL